MPVKETLTAEVFDQLQHAMAANPTGLAELYRDYLADAWQSLQLLREGVQQRQAEAVQARAHYLKSSSLVLGARVVAHCAAMLEEAARTANARDGDKLLQHLQKALQEVQAELKKRLGASVIPAGETAA